MNILDFTSQQIEIKDFPEKEDFFKDFLQEYGRLCKISDEFIKNGIEDEIKKTLKKNLDITLQKVRYILQKSEEKILKFFGNIEIPSVILFIGPFAWDGHGILVKGKPYIFLNLTMINHHFNIAGFIPEVHTIHEIIHGIHYNFHHEFYPGNCKNIKELYFNKFLSEGIATYLSGKINNSPPAASLSFGFMSDDEFKFWITKCLFIRSRLWLMLNEAIIENSYNEELWGNLFLVPDLEPGCLTRGRYGYYYGMKIAEMISEKKGDLSLIKISQKMLHTFVEMYFSDRFRAFRNT